MKYDAIIGAIIALTSGLAGAFWQAVVSRRSEYIKAGRQARYNAYADYFQGIAQLSRLSEYTDQSVAYTIIANARSRIALYGSREVIIAMSKVFYHGDDIRSITAREDLSSMLAAMRADVLWTDPKVPKSALVSLVFGAENVDFR